MLKGPSWTPNSQVSGLSVFLAGLEIPDGSPRRARSQGSSLITAYAPKKGSKKKAQQTSHSQDTPDASASPPPRIIDTSQLSLKRQKRFVDARKKAEQAASGKQMVTKKFRRKPLDPDERYAQERARMEAAQAQRAAQEAMRRQRRAVRDMLRAREEDVHLPVLLVDGYNVLHRKWQLRQDAESCPLNLEDEREALINDTRDYALSLSCRPIVVFDAMANRSPLVTPREMTAGVEVVYTKDSDADIFIMAEAKVQRHAGAPRVVVVSGDAEISASLEYGSAMGWMTSEMYMLEMKRVSHLATKAQRAAEEQQYQELLEGGGNIALSALKDRAMLEKVAELRRRLGSGRAGQGKSLFRMERW